MTPEVLLSSSTLSAVQGTYTASLPSIFTARPEAKTRMRDFFSSHIRNKNTRRAYREAVRQFSAFCVEHGVTDLAQVEPVHVAAFVEMQLKTQSKPTVKVRLAALRMLFDWMVVGQVIPVNPAHAVRGPKYTQRRGKTPVLQADEARTLLDAIDTTSLPGLRDRALIGLMVYTFARVGAAVSMRVEDFYVQGRRGWVRLHEKGGKEHEMPTHHNLDRYLEEYIAAAGIAEDRKEPLFRTTRNRVLRTRSGQAKCHRCNHKLHPIMYTQAQQIFHTVISRIHKARHTASKMLNGSRLTMGRRRITSPGNQQQMETQAIGGKTARLATYRRCAMRHLINGALCTLLFAQGVCAAAQVHNTQSEELYLLTGTETNSGSDAYPVNLYKVDSQDKVALVRTIVQPNQGLFSIRDDQEGHLVIAYPHVVPTNVSVIDKRSPLSSHVSGVNPLGNTVISTAWSVAATDAEHTYVLLPFAKDDKPLDYAMSGVSLIKGAFQPLPAQPWSLYKDLRYDGQPGGGQFDAELQATLSSPEISLTIGGHLVQMCAGPSSFTKEELNAPVSLVALSSRYVVFSFTRTRAEMETGPLKPRKVYVGDRVTGAWKQLEMTSDSPRIRMLGTWLAVIEEDWSPNNETNPGRDSERSSRTRDVPSTRDEYATFQGSNYKITGHLSLISLIDGTVMRINTGQEDSEIEAVHGEDVIYRVNDVLMIANMRGTTVGPARTIAKNDVIPEVHWVFFK